MSRRSGHLLHVRVGDNLLPPGAGPSLDQTVSRLASVIISPKCRDVGDRRARNLSVLLGVSVGPVQGR